MRVFCTTPMDRINSPSHFATTLRYSFQSFPGKILRNFPLSLSLKSLKWKFKRFTEEILNADTSSIRKCVNSFARNFIRVYETWRNETSFVNIWKRPYLIHVGYLKRVSSYHRAFWRHAMVKMDLYAESCSFDYLSCPKSTETVPVSLAPFEIYMKKKVT